MAGGLFDLSKEEAMAEGSSIDYSGMDWFATPITSKTNAKIQALCQPGHSCFLIEFSDDMLAKNAYDIAVYDAQKSAIAFFASGSDGSYQQIAIKRSGTTIVGEAHVADLGWRPTVRGSVMNPCDHPHGGGEGKSPVGRPGPVTPWGKPAMGYKTRKNHNRSDKFIVKRANG